jgi:hypothetical protein
MGPVPGPNVLCLPVRAALSVKAHYSKSAEEYYIGIII